MEPYGEGIILDGRLKYGFLYKAIIDGYAHAEESLKKKMQDFFTKNRNPINSLEYLLLFKKIYIHGLPDGIDVTLLQKEGVVEQLNPSPEYSVGTRTLSSRGGAAVLTPNDIGELILLKPFLFTVFMKIQNKIKPSIIYNSNNWLEFIYNVFLVDCYTQTTDLTSNIEAKKIAKISWLFRDQWMNLRSIIEKSENLSVPAVIDKPTSLQSSKTESEIIQKIVKSPTGHGTYDFKQLEAQSKTKYRYHENENLTEDIDRSNKAIIQACRIYLDEVKVMPRLSNIEHALKLREDKRIVDFRECISEWTKELRIGAVESEFKMRKEIRKANKELKKMGSYNNYSRWITYIALPIGIIESLASFFPVTGIALNIISGTIQLITDKKESEHSWLLLGR